MGWSAYAQQAEYETGSGQTTGGVSSIFRGQFAQVRLNERFAGEDWYFSGEAKGSLVFADNNLYVTRPVGSSFVLVDAGDAAGATVSANYTQTATVDNKGKALLPFVQSYSPLNVGIVPGSLSSDMIGNTIAGNFAFAPGFAQIDIPIRQSLHATGTFLTSTGEPWPPGTEIRTYGDHRDGELRGFVGKHGRAYLEDLKTGESLMLIAGQKSCLLDLLLPIDSPGIVDIGFLKCDHHQ